MNKRIDKDKIKQILLLSKQRNSKREIADKLNISEKTVYNYQKIFHLS